MTKGALTCVVTILSVAHIYGQTLTPSAWRERDSSPRIELLRKSIASGGAPTTEAFWSEITTQGTPLIEPLGDKHALVTFLWRGTPATRNVVVYLSDFGGVRPQDHMMRHLEHSDVWFLTVRLPRAARFLYRLSPNDPLNNAFLGGLLGSNPQPDPLNLKPFFGMGSIAELPGAPAQPWIVKSTNVPAGTVSGPHTVSSKLMTTDRRVWAYTPPGYGRSGPPSDLVILFDGPMYINLMAAPTTFDNLIAANRVGPTVAVFIENPPAVRNDELFWNPTYADFVATEVMPWIRTNFNVTTDPRRVIIGGASGGGAGATYAALRHSGVFGNVLSQSAGFALSPARMTELAERAPGPDGTDRHIAEEIEDRAMTEGGWLAKLYIEAPKRPIRFYMDAGTFEADFMGGGLGALEPNRHMRDVLLAKGYDVQYQEFVGGHDYINWRGTFADGVIALLGKK